MVRQAVLAVLLVSQLQGCALLLTGAAGYSIAKSSSQQKEIDELKAKQAKAQEPETKPYVDHADGR